MKKTLLAIATSLVLAGAMSSTASAQSGYYDGRDRDNDRIDQRQFDYDRDGLADYRDLDDDNDGLSDQRDPSPRGVRYDDDRYDDDRYARDDRYDRDDRYGRNDDRHDRDDRYGREARYGRDDRDGRYDRDDDRRYDGRRHDNGRHTGWSKAHRRYQAGRYVAPRNYRARQWQVGTRLPQGYYGSGYYVNYAPYGLAPPPRGYRWNRVGNDVYLVSTRDGLIRQVVYSLFY